MDKTYKINGQEVKLTELATVWLANQSQPLDDNTILNKAHKISVFAKADEKQIVYGVILRPNVPDSQGDIVTVEEIEEAAHLYMAKYAGQADFLHKSTIPRSDAVMVESFIAPVSFEWNGFQVLKGDWVGGMWIPNEELWGMVKKGTINAFSIKGIGRREPVGT